MDHFENIVSLGLGSRLKRLSDLLISQTKTTYQERELNFEPRWFPLFSLLNKMDKVSITDAAKMLNLTHPHISKTAKELEGKGLIISKNDKSDGRSRTIELSEKGKSLALKLSPTWSHIQKAIEKSFPEIGADIILILKKLEDYFLEESLSNRVKKLENTSKNNAVKIIKYAPQYKKDFERLNRDWLEKYFSVDDIDIQYFQNPEKKILAPGGEIFFAMIDDKVVGTSALFKNQDSFELAKVGIGEKYRGYGIGTKLVEASLNHALKKNCSKVFLITNSKLVPAIRLYQKFGFKVTHLGPHPVYKMRGDVTMEWYPNNTYNLN